MRQAARLVDRPERVWRKVMDQTVAGAGALFEAVRSFMGANAERLIATSQKAVAHYHTEVMARPRWLQKTHLHWVRHGCNGICVMSLGSIILWVRWSLWR